MVRKYLQIGFALLLGLALLVYPFVTNQLPLTPLQVLGLVVGFAGFAFWYLDGRLASVLEQIEEGLKDHVLERNLTDAMNFASQTQKHWKRVRVLATSSGQIQPLFQSSGMTADSVHLILRQVRDDEILANPELAHYKAEIETLIELWRDLERKGRIRALTIQRHPFFPLEYNVIFDDKLLVSGLLIPEKRYSEVNVENPTLTIGRTLSGVREIKKYIERFDHFGAYIAGTASS